MARLGCLPVLRQWQTTPASLRQLLTIFQVVELPGLLDPEIALDAVLGMNALGDLADIGFGPGGDLLEGVDAALVQALLQGVGNAAQEGEVIPAIGAGAVEDA